MAGAKDVTIRTQALDGTWQTMGGETARGIYPEGVTLEADAWGSSVASFNLRRDPRAFFPDIGAFTPVEIDVGSTLVWSGRVRETPAQVAQRVINVQCEGWQFHLDDDIYQRTYVHTNLSEYKDMRSVLSIDLAGFALRQAASVSTDGGITLSFPNNMVLDGSGSRVGVLLDLGAGNSASRLVVDWESSNNDPNIRFIGGVTNAADLSTGADIISFPLNTSSGVGTAAGTAGSAGRYVYLYLVFSGSTVTTTQDYWIRIRSCQAFADTTFESGNASVLKASTVVADALSKATILLSTDMSGIDQTTFPIPSYAPGYQTPRQAWTAVDAYHDWLKKIDVQRRPIYTAKPSRPIFEVGPWSAIDDDDASANSGAEIFNKAIVTSQDPVGNAVVTTKRPASTSTTKTIEPSLQPSSIAAVGSNASKALWSAGTFRAGFEYIADLYTTNTSGSIINSVGGPIFGVDPTDLAFGRTNFTLNPGDSISLSVSWTPKADTAATSVILQANGTIQWAVIYRGSVTLVDRRGFRRAMQLPVSSVLPSDGVAAGQIGSAWLTDHLTTPFRGSVTIASDESLRDIATGSDVGLERLLLATGQMLRFSDRSDPDTGGHGRDGRIAAVSYMPTTNTAAVTIDNSRTSFDALLARLAIIQGG